MRALALAAAVLATNDVCEDDGVCLLTLRHSEVRLAASMDRTTDFKPLFLQVQQRRAALAEWQRTTEMLRERVFQDPSLKDMLKPGGMDDFIRAQERSDDKCHSKQLEAKRSLDGLLHSVQQVSAEIEGETAVVTSNTEILEAALGKKKAAEEKKADCLDTCAKTKEDDLKTELGKINEELEEMKNIAKPDARSNVKTDVNYTDEVVKAADVERKKAADAVGSLLEKEQQKILAEHVKDLPKAPAAAPAPAKSALLQTGLASMDLALVVMDAGKCQAFAQVVDRVNTAHQLGLNSTAKDDCSDKRRDLQREFTKAYLAIADMYDRKNQEIKDEFDQCTAACNATFGEEDQAVKDEIKAATEAIAKAKDTLEDLEPMLAESQKSVEKLRKHVRKMEDTCVVSGDVSEHLKKIRELITSLQECPGKNDFTLDIPEWTAKTPSLLRKQSIAAKVGSAANSTNSSA